MALSIEEYETDDDRYSRYQVYFFSDHRILTTVTDDPDIVTNWIDEIESMHQRRLHHLIVGLDIEWRPSFNRYQQNPVATLQLCVGHHCLIFQLLYCEYIPNSLVDFLSNSSYTFVGVGIKGDADKLEKGYDISVDNVVDLRDVAADVYNMGNLRNAGLKTLCDVVLGREIEKPRRVTMGRWDNEFLNLDQVQYACVDAFVSFEIGRRLNAFHY